ncbi:hypothetical protein Dvul_0904 [Nitratidesulfovibrio vulgaris DP4]|uniref:Uncharacterized protein n=1 Tax=Nitratidesulfovibrio vulgaris (strain DP4) TaxID=391774 RepID=A0A0H3A8X3_NITV4|nr:hypothetical protein Dvul_0904 [Nitratidesulfovibrio vulgaris DP4]
MAIGHVPGMRSFLFPHGICLPPGLWSHNIKPPVRSTRGAFLRHILTSITWSGLFESRPSGLLVEGALARHAPLLCPSGRVTR